MESNIKSDLSQLSRDIQLPSDRDVDVANFLNSYLSAESKAKEDLPLVLEALRRRSHSLQHEISLLIREEQRERCRGAKGVWKTEEVKESMHKMQNDIEKLQSEARDGENALEISLKDARLIEVARTNVQKTKEVLDLFTTTERRILDAEAALRDKDLEAFVKRSELWEDIVKGNKRLEHLSKRPSTGVGLQRKKRLKGREVALREDLRTLVIARYDLLAGRIAEYVVAQSLTEKTKPTVLAVIERLKESCNVASLLGPDVQAELIGVHVKSRLRIWRQSFDRLDVFSSIGKRYTWLKRELKTSWAGFGEEREDRGWALVFPRSWSIPTRLADAVLRATKADIERQFSQVEAKVDVEDMVSALQLSRNFETELGSSFKMFTDIQDDATPLVISMESLSDSHPQNTAVPSFKGIVSSCFEPHLDIYIRALDREISQTLLMLLRQESWHLPKENAVLSSASSLFLTLKRTLSASSQVSTYQPLFSLHRYFRRHLESYAAGLGKRLSSLSYSADEKSLNDSLLSVCAIARTADYCAATVDGLRSAFVSSIDPAFKNDIDFSSQLSFFKTIVSRSISKLATLIDHFLDQYMKPIGSVPWATSLKATGDTTVYVSVIMSTMGRKITIIKPHLSVPQQRVLMQKVVGNLMQAYSAAILSIPLLNPIAAQQLLLDAAAFKSSLTKFIETNQSSASQNLKSTLHSQMLRVEGILKATLAPQETTRDVYERKVINGSRKELARICEMKGISHGEASKIVLAFTSGSISKSIPPNTKSSRPTAVRPKDLMSIAQPSMVRNKSQITTQIERTGNEAVEAVTGSVKRSWGKFGEFLTGGVETAAETMRKEALARGFSFGNR